MDQWILQGGIGLLVLALGWFIKRELQNIRIDITQLGDNTKTEIDGLGSRLNSYNTRLSRIEGKLGFQNAEEN